MTLSMAMIYYQRLVKLGKLALEGKQEEKVIFDGVNLPSDLIWGYLLNTVPSMVVVKVPVIYNFFPFTDARI